MNMVSVERVLDYVNLSQEAPLSSNSSFEILRDEIEFKEVELKFRQNFLLF